MIRRFLATATATAAVLVACAVPLAASAQVDDQPVTAPAAPAETATMMPGASHRKTSSANARFTTEEAAQAHCPSDTVVWVNSKSGAVHPKGDAFYGKTKHGAFACSLEAGKTRLRTVQATPQP